MEFDEILPSYAQLHTWHTYPGGKFSNRQLYELNIVILLEGDQLKYDTQHEIRREFFINSELTIEKFAGWSVYQYPEIRIKGVGRQYECNLVLYLER